MRMQRHFGHGNRARCAGGRFVRIVAVGFTGLSGYVFAERSYVLREALLALACSASLAFLGFNVLLLGGLMRAADQRMLRFIKRALKNAPKARVRPGYEIVLYKATAAIGEVRKA